MKSSHLPQGNVSCGRFAPWPVRGGAMRRAWWHVQDAVAVLAWVLMLPFRAIAGVGRMATATGRGLLRWTIQLCFGLIGFSFVGIVGFGMVRVIFHPLFVR